MTDTGPHHMGRHEPRRGRGLLAVGVALIAVGAAALLVSVGKGWSAGFAAVPATLVILLGGVFVLIWAGVDDVDVTLDDHRAGLHVNSPGPTSTPPDVSLAPAVRDPVGLYRRRRQCRLRRRIRA